MDQGHLDGVQLIIECRDDTRFLHDLAVVLIHCVQIFRLVHNGGQGFKTALALLFDGDMSPINLDDHVARRRCALLRGWWERILVGEDSTHFVRHPFDVHMVIHPPGVPIPRLQVLFSLSVAIQRPLCTVQGG